MSYTVHFAPQVQAQLDAIEDYIASASGFPTIAAKFIDAIVDYCERFETFPERGTRRDDLLSGLRTIGYRNSVTIAFRVNTKEQLVSILGVFYGGRNYESLLANEHVIDAEN